MKNPLVRRVSLLSSYVMISNQQLNEHSNIILLISVRFFALFLSRAVSALGNQKILTEL